MGKAGVGWQRQRISQLRVKCTEPSVEPSLHDQALLPSPTIPAPVPLPRTSARTWSKMGSSTESNTRSQNWGEKEAPWNLRMSNSTSSALYLQAAGVWQEANQWMVREQ